MVSNPLLQLNDISLRIASKQIFKKLKIIVNNGERLALVGRNGSGKSTLLKVMAGLLMPDEGTISFSAKVKVGYLEQEPTMTNFNTLNEYITNDLKQECLSKLERIRRGLKFDSSFQVETASGGEKRKAALVKMLVGEPDLFLFDEPTNHLDIEAIKWLEAYLAKAKGAAIFISHDRKFLTNLTNSTLWIDRGKVRRYDKGFARFETWREKIWAREAIEESKLNKKVVSEARWAVEGISGRRKRNQRRLKALISLREEQAVRSKKIGVAQMNFATASRTGKKVIELFEVSKSFHDSKIIERFSTIVQRGERIALVGPNGVGKTTLLKILMDQVSPDSGCVKRGTNLQPVFFDQTRDELDPLLSLCENLCSEKNNGILGKTDLISVRGKPKHAVGYLKEFLFEEKQVRSPVSSLSGGEKARLLLAKIMAKESNFLLLDEPTNDLDIETLDLLQELLTDFDGTVFFASHDRDFIDRVATKVFLFEGGGQLTVFAGGWSGIESRKPSGNKKSDKKHIKGDKNLDRKSFKERKGLSFREKERLRSLPQIIHNLESDIARLEQLLSDSELYKKERLKFEMVTEVLLKRKATLSIVEEEWLALEEKAFPS